MLIDEIDVTLIGGHGGAGIVSFGNKQGSGPDGGNGGKGGDLYVKAITDITLLNQFSHKNIIEAPDGFNGAKKRQSGKDGADITVLLPVGTTIIDRETGEEIIELKERNQVELLSKGGLGGRGNYEFRSSRHTTPMHAQKGLAGEKKELHLVLKLLADFGLVGLPNAGKSSLLNELTRAKAKTANYAFTTLSPNLGVLKGKVIADIPGLIEGASQGRGLGTSFLKHIEKVGVILHCISSESMDPLKDYNVVQKELKNYDPKLLKKKEIIVITKSDLIDKSDLAKIKTKLKKKSNQVVEVSIHDLESLENLADLLFL